MSPFVSDQSAQMKRESVQKARGTGVGSRTGVFQVSARSAHTVVTLFTDRNRCLDNTHTHTHTHIYIYIYCMGARGSVVIKALCYKVAGSIPDEVFF
jgi:hypothetical protein